jgi:ABC-2 type transport system ATP-binding protein
MLDMSRGPAVVVESLAKHYGATSALQGVDLTVERGTILGLLGPNGAGKTTMVRILATLLHPDSGRARVDGFDVAHDGARVRSRIGLAGQYAAVDELLTGRANLEMIGRLYRLSARQTRARAVELLEQFQLTEAAGRAVKTYSGGMRRRHDLAASIVASPPVLFLDEPTTGLDPRSRADMWDLVRALVSDGATVLLTTQYLDEADQLADRIVVIDHGRVIAEGTPSQLKSSVGGSRIDVVLQDAARLEAAARVIRAAVGDPVIDLVMRQITVQIADGSGALVDVVRQLDAAGIAIDDIGLRRPTLDEVFLQLTGASVSAAETEAPARELIGAAR